MSRESIAFLKKWQDKQRRKRSGKCQKSDHFDHASIVPVLFQKNNDRFMAAQEAKLCFNFFLEALFIFNRNTSFQVIDQTTENNSKDLTL